jgi:hypothetical protein
MGFKVWIPKSDRERVKSASAVDLASAMIDILPMNYNDATIRTIEQIDVIWLRGRSIARAFEIEHTTAIYSGLLRMADLVALQPDINIPLHIVAPEARQETVLDQIKRPVFSLLETGPLSERCSLLNYDDVRELAEKPELSHLKDSIPRRLPNFRTLISRSLHYRFRAPLNLGSFLWSLGYQSNNTARSADKDGDALPAAGNLKRWVSYARRRSG